MYGHYERDRLYAPGEIIHGNFETAYVYLDPAATVAAQRGNVYVVLALDVAMQAAGGAVGEVLAEGAMLPSRAGVVALDAEMSASLAARGTAGAIEEGTTVYRVFGGEARGLGRSWTTVNPGSVENYRRAAGLFPENSGQFLIEGRLTNTKGVLFRDALPGPNGVGGGLPEVVIPNPGSQVCVLGVCGVNPAF